MVKLGEQVKAVVAGVTAGLGALVTALADQQVSQAEWVVVALAAVGAYQAAYWVPNGGGLPHLSSGELLELAERAAERERQR